MELLRCVFLKLYKAKKASISSIIIAQTCYPYHKCSYIPNGLKNKKTGEISYSYTTQEKVEFGGIVNATIDEVHIEFYVKNHTDSQIRHVTPQFCLPMAKSNDFNQQGNTSGVFIWSDGKYLSLDESTPTPVEKKRDPLLIIRSKGFSNGI